MQPIHRFARLVGAGLVTLLLAGPLVVAPASGSDDTDVDTDVDDDDGLDIPKEGKIGDPDEIPFPDAKPRAHDEIPFPEAKLPEPDAP